MYHHPSLAFLSMCIDSSKSPLSVYPLFLVRMLRWLLAVATFRDDPHCVFREDIWKTAPYRRYRYCPPTIRWIQYGTEIKGNMEEQTVKGLEVEPMKQGGWGWPWFGPLELVGVPYLSSRIRSLIGRLEVEWERTLLICVGRTSADGIEKSQYRWKVFCDED